MESYIRTINPRANLIFLKARMKIEQERGKKKKKRPYTPNRQQLYHIHRLYIKGTPRLFDCLPVSKVFATVRCCILHLNSADTVHALPTFFLILLIYKITMLPLMTLNNCQITKCKRQKTPTSKAKFLKFQGKYCNLTVSKSNQRLKSLLTKI